jgi:hypothetical protein
MEQKQVPVTLRHSRDERELMKNNFMGNEQTSESVPNIKEQLVSVFNCRSN